MSPLSSEVTLLVTSPVHWEISYWFWLGLCICLEMFFDNQRVWYLSSLHLWRVSHLIVYIPINLWHYYDENNCILLYAHLEDTESSSCCQYIYHTESLVGRLLDIPDSNGITLTSLLWLFGLMFYEMQMSVDLLCSNLLLLQSV